jgi:cytochrome P450
VFANPDVFDPDRFAPPHEEDRRHPYAQATFGGGSRVRIGMNVAQVEVKALAAHVLRSYALEPIGGLARCTRATGRLSFRAACGCA